MLSSSWDTYINGLPRHDRHELRRKMKNFVSTHGNLSFSASHHPSSDIDDLLSLMHRDQYKHTFLTPQMERFFRKLPETFPDQLLLFLLRSGKTTAAALLAWKAGKSLLTYNSGYHEEEFSGAGFYLKAKAIQWAIENGYNEYNFLQGSEPYKYQLGGKDFFVYNITVNL